MGNIISYVYIGVSYTMLTMQEIVVLEIFVELYESITVVTVYVCPASSTINRHQLSHEILRNQKNTENYTGFVKSIVGEMAVKENIGDSTFKNYVCVQC